MLIQNIFSWGVVAMLSSLFLSTGSVDRNSTSSLNGLNASAKEMKEAKGCSTNFVCPTGTLPFYYNHNDYLPTNVEDVTKWKLGYNPNSECDGFAKACLICVGLAYVEGEDEDMTLKSDLIIISDISSTDTAFVSGSNDTQLVPRNEN